MPTKAANAGALQISVALAHIHPLVWRRLVISPDLTLADLHRVIQRAMGWQGYHLHVFDVRGDEYGVPHPGDDPPVLGEGTLTLREALPRVRSSLFYTYDFGDNWEHQVRLEARLPEPALTPRCIAGAQACPPEDCGGPPDYVLLLEALADHEHSEHEELTEWIGGDFDPTAFDLDEVNVRLAQPFS